MHSCISAPCNKRRVNILLHFWTKSITSYLRECEATLASWILCVGIDRCLRLYTSQESPLVLYHLLTCSQHLPFRVSAERLSHFAVVHCSSNTLQEGRGLEVKRGQFSYKRRLGNRNWVFFGLCAYEILQTIRHAHT